MEAFLPWEAELVEKSTGEMLCPWNVGAVSEAHLTAMLQSSSTISAAAKVSKITEKKALGGNDEGRFGVLSCIFRISMEYEGGEGPATVIYKTTPLTADFYPLRGLCKGMRAWELEVNAYNSGLPFTNLPTCKSYFAVQDPEASRYALLLEDLNARSEGMAGGDQILGLTQDQVSTATVVFEGAAEFHATHWNKTKAMECAKFAKETDDAFWPNVFPLMYGATWEGFQPALAGAGIPLDADVKEFGDYIGTCVSDHCLWNATTKETGGFMNSTVIHCDFRLDNFFFDYAADGSTMNVGEDGKPLWCVIDWQLVSPATVGPCNCCFRSHF